jgi:hypothetical protein
MLVVLVMCMQWPSKVQEVDGNKCLETGGKIGNPTLTSMDSHYLLRSQQVMAELWSPTMLHLLAGPLVRLLVVHNFTESEKTLLAFIYNMVVVLIFCYYYSI